MLLVTQVRTVTARVVFISYLTYLTFVKKLDSITTLPAARMLYDLGEMLIEDDKSDIGYFAYRNRKYHKYHGKKAPDHPLPFHHWQIGGLLCIVGQLAAAIELAKETANDFQEPSQQQ